MTIAFEFDRIFRIFMEKIVVKVGTSSLMGEKALSKQVMLGLVEQVVNLRVMRKEVVLVSSGAVAAGREVLEQASKPMSASVGQVRLMQAWAELFGLFDVYVGQVLLTRQDFNTRLQNTRETLEGLLRHKIVPVVNENDTVVTQECRIGDNDNLAALVAGAIEADAVILLTDQEGLYTADPRIDREARLVPVVEKIDDAIFALAGGTLGRGTGGMKTKIEAAKIAAKKGARTIIASASRPNVLLDLVQGKAIGTMFMQEDV